MQLATGFHYTRVKDQDVQDYNKLKYMIGYMWRNRFFPLIIGIDEKGNRVIYIGGAHTVHSDGKGYPDLYVTIGYSVIINASKKLGLVTTSSTKIEVVSNRERFLKCT